MRIVRTTVVSSFVLAALAPDSAVVQVYPVRAIRLIVVFPPGGGADVIGRILPL